MIDLADINARIVLWLEFYVTIMGTACITYKTFRTILISDKNVSENQQTVWNV